MTIGQIKQLSLIDNLINIDLRSIISGFSFLYKEEMDCKINKDKINKELYYTQLAKYNKEEIDRLMVKMSEYIDENIR